MKRGWSAICDRCGFTYRSWQLKKEWNGLMTCRACWEPRHPQDFVRVPAETVSVPWVRSEPADEFAAVCYLPGLSCYAGLAVAGCSIPGNQQFSVEFLMDF